MARIVALGDAHLGRSHLAHLRDDQGRNVREEDFLRSFTWAVEETIRLEPDGFVWLGDVFDHARPTYRTFAHVLAGLQSLASAGLPGVAISGNHDTPRVRGTGSPYDALERVFPNVAFAWRMEAMRAEIAGVQVHAVPQTLGIDELRQQLTVAGEAVVGDATNLLIAHVALTSLPARAYRDINELEVEEGAYLERAFGHLRAEDPDTFAGIERGWTREPLDLPWAIGQTLSAPRRLIMTQPYRVDVGYVFDCSGRRLALFGESDFIFAAALDDPDLADFALEVGAPL